MSATTEHVEKVMESCMEKFETDSKLLYRKQLERMGDVTEGQRQALWIQHRLRVLDHRETLNHLFKIT